MPSKSTSGVAFRVILRYALSTHYSKHGQHSRRQVSPLQQEVKGSNDRGRSLILDYRGGIERTVLCGRERHVK